MSCIRMFCFVCKQMAYVCDGICDVCGTFHEMEEADGGKRHEYGSVVGDGEQRQGSRA